MGVFRRHSSESRQRRLAMPERDALKAWFLREILPLEPAVMRFIRRNWRTEADVVDLRQENYVRIYESACQRLPLNPKPFLFATARNHLIHHCRREPGRAARRARIWQEG